MSEQTAMERKIRWWRESGGGGDITEIALLVEELLDERDGILGESRHLAGVVAQLQQDAKAEGAECFDAQVRGEPACGECRSCLTEKLVAAEGALAHLREQVRAAFEAGWIAFQDGDDPHKWHFDGEPNAQQVDEAYAAYTAALASPGERREEDKK